MKKITILLIALIVMTFNASAQWRLQTNPLGSGTSAMVGKVQFVSTTEGWIDASHSGSLLHTTDGGTTWNVVNPFPSDTVGNMSDPATTMSWINPTHGWALKTYIVGSGDITGSGNGAVLYNTTNGGGSWTKKEFPKTITTITYSTADLQGTWQLHELVAKNPSSGSTNQAAWIHGMITLDGTGSGSMTNLISNGQSKSDLNGLTLSISTTGLLSVSGSDMQGFMSTDKSTIIITSTENGGGYGLIVLQKQLSETTYTTSDLQGNWQMHGLSVGNGTGSRAGWVHATWIGDAGGNFSGNFVGVGGVENLNTSVSISSSGIISGMSSIGSDVHGFMSADKKTFYMTATGSNGYFNLVTFQKQVSGTTYSSTDLQGNWQLHSIVADNTNDTEAWAGWTHAKITMDADGNGTLSNFVVNNESRSEQDVSISISADGILSGFGSDDSNGFMSTDKSIAVVTTTDAGSGGYTFGTMQKDLTVSGDIGLQVQFVDNNNGWASNYNMIYSKFVLYKTTDGGSTWNSTNSNAGGFYQFMDANNGWMIGTSVSNVGQDKQDNIYHTTNGGTTWTLQAENIGSSNALYFTDLLHGWVVGKTGLILKTTDGGTNWIPITNAGLSTASNSKCVFFLDADTGWIGTHKDGENEHYVLATTDGGVSWTSQSTPVDNDIFSLNFRDATNGWLTSDNGQIAHYIYTPPKTVNITAGGLSSALTTTEKATLTDMIVTGTMDARDFKTMRDLMPVLANIDLSGVSISAYTGTEGTYNTTSYYYPANTVPRTALYKKGGNTTLMSFIAPATTTAIGRSAFNSCTAITTMSIPSGVNSIGYAAFGFCSNLNSINIPSGVTKIDSMAFYNCSTLKSVNFESPSQLNTIGEYAFGFCSELSSFEIPSSVTKIESLAFYNCSTLESVNFDFPSQLNTIGEYAFGFCSELSSFEIPSSVTNIGDIAFLGSGVSATVNSNNTGFSALEGVLFDKDMTRLMYCPSMKDGSYAIPSSVTDIAIDAFYNCSGINSITIPASVTTLEDWAFEMCTGLSSVTIPASVNSIGSYAFYNCSGLTTIYANAVTPVDLSKSDSVFYNINMNNCILKVPKGSKAAYQVANKWKDFINVEEFSIFPIIIENATHHLGDGAGNEGTVMEFSFNYPLDPSNVSLVLKFCLPYGPNYQNPPVLKLNNQSLGSIQSFFPMAGYPNSSGWSGNPDNSADYNGSFYVKIPVKSYIQKGQNIFRIENGRPDDDYFFNLAQIVDSTWIEPKTMQITAGGLYSSLTSTELKTTTDLTINGTLDARDFRIMRDSMPLLTNLDISGVSIVEYTGTEGTSGSTSIKYWVDNLPPNAFQNPVTFVGKQTLKSIILPSYLWAIGGAAFANSALEKVVMPSTLYEIQSWSFSGSQIDSMYIPASVTTIGSSAFGGTNKLSSIGVSGDNQYFTSVDGVLFDKSVTKLLAFPSAKCQSYTIPTGVTSIEANAFQASDYLQELTIPSTVTKIGNSAFIWSWGLKKVIIPASVTTIEANAFNSCGNLSKIYVGSSTPLDLSSSADVFLNVDKTSCILYVPVGSKAAYQAAGQWKDFQNIVETGGSVTYNVTVPAGTKACYIAGEMNNWLLQIMYKVDNTHYTIKIQNADISQQYKFCSGPTWEYVEVDANGNYDSNRDYVQNDVVAGWLAVFDPSTVTASDYYLPLKTGNYTELYTTYVTPDGWAPRTTRYSYNRTNEINGIPYFLEEGWDGNFSNCNDCTVGPFRYMWIRKDSFGNLLLGAYAVEDYGGTLTDDFSKAYILPQPAMWFPNTFLNVGGYTAYAVQDTVMKVDSVISVTAIAGNYSNCIQLRDIQRTKSGFVTFIEDSYYAYHVGLVMQNRLLPVKDIHTNYITGYQADSYTGIKNIKSSDNTLTLYPNPAQDRINIEQTDNQSGETMVSIFNMQGKELLNNTFRNQNVMTLTIGTLSKDIYFVKVINNMNVTVMKFIKQ